MQDTPRFNIPLPTLGGKQLWQDTYLYGGWRIQRHTLTGHCRLLDRGGYRRGWGTEAACEAILVEARTAGKVTLSSTRVCILLHGYLRSKDSFGALTTSLRDAVYDLNYPSTRAPLEELAADFAALFARVSTDFEEVNIVTHSMGGLIARKVLATAPPKPGRLVMIAPPNQGAKMADLLLDSWPSEYLAGPAGKQLVTGAAGFAKSAGVPQCEFGVIAGIRGDGGGWNPAIPGDDDGLVGLDDARMEGMRAFGTVKAMHTFIMNHTETIAMVLRFLDAGCFTADGTKPKD